MLANQSCTVFVWSSVMALTLLPMLALSAATGYHYDRPISGPAPSSGHKFAALPTVVPLPPVPALPPLPTARSGGYRQSFQQVHPTPTATYLPASQVPTRNSYTSQVTQNILQPQAPVFSGYGSTGSSGGGGFTSTGAGTSSGFGSGSGFGVSGLGVIAPTAPSSSSYSSSGSAAQTQPPPLRIPFGTTALIQTTATPNSAIYIQNGRPLKQYAVVEVISNDIEPSQTPFLSPSFIDSFRARVDNNHIGADAFSGNSGLQINSRANALVLEQQSLAAQLRSSPGDAVALGSGGLGYIRLPNGNIYLGSGSLGYISGQQHEQDVRNARTRTGSPNPDPLHFGHGPLGGSFNTNFLRFK